MGVRAEVRGSVLESGASVVGGPDRGPWNPVEPGLGTVRTRRARETYAEFGPSPGANPVVGGVSCDRPLLLEQSSPGFPPELRRVPSPPGEIFVRGRLELLARTPRVAIVGTRAPTPYGESQARHFARVLGAAGVVVVSGLARGIDEAAHGGALDVGAASVAVLGSGVDRPWPAGPLAERMLREGLLLSEFAPGEGPRKHHFPLRNRLIAGLSRAVVVIEAAHASGSLITARWAVDMGKDVYALPGRVDHPMARGCHRLLREGAALVETPEELLVELGLARRRRAAWANSRRATSGRSRPRSCAL
jgi:DNA processing protein